MWVNTGGVLPAGADAVLACTTTDDVRFQDLQGEVEPWRNVARRGADWRAGERILPAGARVGARELALLYEAGVTRVTGWASPRVAVVATGSEMCGSAEVVAPGRRRCSNAHYVVALMRLIGVKDLRTFIVPDDAEALAGTLRALRDETDVIVTIGGTGRGRRDYTRPAVLAAGGVFVGHDAETNAPFVTARVGGAAMIGLPGNPLAVMVLVQRVLLERIREVFLLSEGAAETVRARMGEPVEAGGTGALCVALQPSFDGNGFVARPIEKGTGCVRVFEEAAGTVSLTGNALTLGEWVDVVRFRN